MNTYDQIKESRLRVIWRMLKEDPTFSIKMADLTPLLAKNVADNLDKRIAELAAEKAALNAPYSSMNLTCGEWWVRCRKLHEEYSKWIKARDRRIAKGTLRTAWLYKNYSAFNERAGILALEYQNFDSTDKKRFVDQTDPLYIQPRSRNPTPLDCALPYPRTGYEHRPELYQVTRTAQIEILDALLEPKA